MDETGQPDSVVFGGGLEAEPLPDGAPGQDAQPSPDAGGGLPGETGEREPTGEGQDGGDTSASGHDLNPEVTRLQQQYAEERRQLEAERDFLRQQMEAVLQQRQPQAPAEPAQQIDPAVQQTIVQAFQQSPFQQKLDEARMLASSAVAMAADSGLRGRDYYDQPGVREQVLRSVANVQVTDPVQMQRAIDLAYLHATQRHRDAELAELRKKTQLLEAERQRRAVHGGPTSASTRAPGGAPAVDVSQLSTEELANMLGEAGGELLPSL